MEQLPCITSPIPGKAPFLRLCRLFCPSHTTARAWKAQAVKRLLAARNSLQRIWKRNFLNKQLLFKKLLQPGTEKQQLYLSKAKKQSTLALLLLFGRTANRSLRRCVFVRRVRVRQELAFARQSLWKGCPITSAAADKSLRSRHIILLWWTTTCKSQTGH